MDIMRFDERQKLGWLLANRALIFIIGIVWLAMIAYELFVQNQTPLFLIIMVPVFALLRYFFYLYYSKKKLALQE